MNTPAAVMVRVELEGENPSPHVDIARVELELGRAFSSPWGELYLGPWSFVRQEVPKLVNEIKNDRAIKGAVLVHVLSSLAHLEEPVDFVDLADARDSMQRVADILMGKTSIDAGPR